MSGEGGVQLIDDPSASEIDAAARIWQEAESLRVRDVPYGSYLEDQRCGFVDTMTRVDAWLTVAVCSSEVIGLVGGISPSTDAPTAYLGYIAVTVAHRRLGLGRMLLLHAERRATLMPAEQMLLTVHESNSDAQHVYEQAGWSRTGTTSTTPLSSELLIEYTLDLDRNGSDQHGPVGR